MLGRWRNREFGAGRYCRSNIPALGARRLQLIACVVNPLPSFVGLALPHRCEIADRLAPVTHPWAGVDRGAAIARHEARARPPENGRGRVFPVFQKLVGLDRLRHEHLRVVGRPFPERGPLAEFLGVGGEVALGPPSQQI